MSEVRPKRWERHASGSPSRIRRSLRVRRSAGVVLFVLAAVAGAPAAIASQETALAVVIRVKPPIVVISADGTRSDASVGRRLVDGDRLVPGEGGEAVVVSRTGTRLEVREAVRIGDPGGGEESDLFQRTVQVLAHAATADQRRIANRTALIRGSDRPVPLRPASGIVITSPRPTFVWSGGDDESEYVVRLESGSGDAREYAVGTDTTWTLRPYDPALIPGERYRWWVAPDRGPPGPDASFTVAGAELHREIAEQIDALRESGLDPAGDGLLITATIYADARLFEEAAAALERLECTQQPLDPGFWLLKGAVLTELDRLEEATAAYEAAEVRASCSG